MAIICPILFCAAHGETRDVLLHAFAYNNQIEQTILFFLFEKPAGALLYHIRRRSKRSFTKFDYIND
jgi:hypothetical protein